MSNQLLIRSHSTSYSSALFLPNSMRGLRVPIHISKTGCIPFQVPSRSTNSTFSVFSLYSNPPPNSGYNPRDDAWYQTSQQRRNSIPPISQEEEIHTNQRWEADTAQGSKRSVEEGARSTVSSALSPPPSSPSPHSTIPLSRGTPLPQELTNYENNGATTAGSTPGNRNELFSSYDFAQTLAIRAIWIVAPITLLVTAALPSICLPVTYLFSGSALAGLLALVGLDGFFNVGATAYLLMSSSSAESWANLNKGNFSLEAGFRNEGKFDRNRRYSDIIPKSYRVWTWAINVSGLMIPVIGLVAAYAHGHILTRSDLLPVLAMLGPYLFILFVQTVAESLVRLWESPVWPVLPLVYQSYRIVQLARAVDLGLVLAAPNWLTVGIKMLAAWWVMVIAMQALWLVRFMALLKRI